MKLRHCLFLAVLVLLVLSCKEGADSDSLRVQHPDDATKDVEYFLERPAGTAPWPTVVLLHGHQEWRRPGGRDFVDWGVLKQLASRGYLAVAISQPGYGASTGPADFSGARTQRAVSGVIAKLRADGLAAPNKLLIEGISRGALTAALIAAQDPSVSGLVLISGVYDLPAYVADSSLSTARKAIVASIVSETGGGADELIARSVLRRAGGIKARALILNGAMDDRTDPSQAQAFAEQIERGGGDARAIIYPDFGHRIPVEVRSKDIDPFIDEVLGSACRHGPAQCSRSGPSRG